VRQIVLRVVDRPQVRRLMTVPAVNVICAATFRAAVCDVRLLPNSVSAGRLPRP
jgi:transposase